MPDQPDNLIGLAAQRAVGDRSSRFPGVEGLTEIPPPASGSGKSISDLMEEIRQHHLDHMVSVIYANHKIMPEALGQQCTAVDFGVGRHAKVPCTNFATHKIAEQGGDLTFHELSSYVCCEHFRAVMGRCTIHG